MAPDESGASQRGALPHASAGAGLRCERVAVVPRFLDARLARLVYNTLVIRAHRGEGRRDDQVPGALSYWGDATLDALLLTLRAQVESVCGCPVLPTYCYARLYASGDTLARHRDRAACEIAVTVHLGHSGDAPPPPIHFDPDVAVVQEPGDAVVYLGTEVDHWRDTFVGRRFGQLFLNYVRGDGDFGHLAFDGRQDAFPPDLLTEPER